MNKKWEWFPFSNSLFALIGKLLEMEMEKENYDVVIVGGGASGIGIAAMLKDFGVERMVVLEREKVGATFYKWPKEMQFITPSFTTNYWGHIDLNSVASGTSPAFSLDTEHPSGERYARYLELISEHWELPIEEGEDVEEVMYSEGRFAIHTKKGKVYDSRFLIWAAGEFQYPRTHSFSGSQLCLHNSLVESWEQIEGDEIYIIGGNESGMDAAINLSRLGKNVRVLHGDPNWDKKSTDPSENLAPFTLDRLSQETVYERIQNIGESVVTEVKLENDQYLIYVEGKSSPYLSVAQPVLATGFNSSAIMIENLFDWDENKSYCLLNEKDESLKTPGLFLVGPQVRHNNLIFCFIYKFRQRFGVVANAIGEQLGMDTSFLEQYFNEGLYLDELSGLDEECAC